MIMTERPDGHLCRPESSALGASSPPSWSQGASPGFEGVAEAVDATFAHVLGRRPSDLDGPRLRAILDRATTISADDNGREVITWIGPSGWSSAGNGEPTPGQQVLATSLRPALKEVLRLVGGIKSRQSEECCDHDREEVIGVLEDLAGQLQVEVDRSPRVRPTLLSTLAGQLHEQADQLTSVLGDDRCDASGERAYLDALALRRHAQFVVEVVEGHVDEPTLVGDLLDVLSDDLSDARVCADRSIASLSCQTLNRGVLRAVEDIASTVKDQLGSHAIGAVRAAPRTRAPVVRAVILRVLDDIDLVLPHVGDDEDGCLLDALGCITVALGHACSVVEDIARCGDDDDEFVGSRDDDLLIELLDEDELVIGIAPPDAADDGGEPSAQSDQTVEAKTPVKQVKRKSPTKKAAARKTASRPSGNDSRSRSGNKDKG